MTARLQKVPGGFTATFDRHYKHTADEVWAYLTDNELLSKWFPELRSGELCIGGSMTFDIGDGTYEVMGISDYALPLCWSMPGVRIRSDLSLKQGREKAVFG
ncbi:hypothetical protein [Paenibacillus sp. DMB5]|uniref:hypothetical protein n=1 Tax=Paenibacillus sp. DMB5 TaxID=1780103 RepID=UPI001F51CD25|nr:hypothetical protein [Paenibacillus sp. DMB5]